MSPLAHRPPSVLPLMVAALVLLATVGAGSAYAGAKVATKNIRNGAVTSAKIKDQTIRAVDVAPDARADLTGPTGTPGATGAPGISGYQRVQAFTTLEADDTGAVVSASCPPGKKLLGGGGYSQDGDLYLVYSYPQENDVYAITAVLRPGGTVTAGLQVSATAICAKVAQ